MTLGELLSLNPDWPQALTDAQAQAWLDETVPVPRTVSTDEVRQYLTTQVNGSGVGQRNALDAIREYAEAGTVAGGSAGETAPDARRSGARMILEMLRYGGASVFEVDNAAVRSQFINIGPDGGNGPSVLSAAQLNAIDALATSTVARWALADGFQFASSWDDASKLSYIAQARAG